MLSQDDFQLAKKLADKTQAFFIEHHIPPTPINYTVVYLCFSNNNDEITAAIANQLANQKSIDSVFLEDVFYNSVLKDQAGDVEFMTPFSQLLTDTMAKLDGHVVNQQIVINNLAKVDEHLTQHQTDTKLQAMLTVLNHELNNNKLQQEKLSQELTKASNEVNHLKEKLQKTRREALIDPLTGLFNRRGCTEQLSNISNTEHHSSLVIDIDHFKLINDNFGHAIGDKVLQRVAKEINSQLHDIDFAVRFGGEEFLVFLARKTLAEAKVIAEKIRLSVEQLKLMQRNANKHLPTITVSIGIAELEPQEEWMELFNRADRALYYAKNNGRNRSIFGTKVKEEDRFFDVNSLDQLGLNKLTG